MSNLTDWIAKVQSEAPVDRDAVRTRVIEALREIYDLGLIYAVDVDDAGVVEVRMTLTTPGCPVAQSFPGMVEDAIRNVEGVSAAHVELVWDPPWCADNLSMEVKLQLGLL